MACVPSKRGCYNSFIDVDVPSARTIFSRVGAIDASSLQHSGDDVISPFGMSKLDTLAQMDKLNKDYLDKESNND